MKENKEPKIENNKPQKKVLKLSLKTFIIIAAIIAVIVVEIIIVLVRNGTININKKNVKSVKNNKENTNQVDTNTNHAIRSEKVEFADYVQVTDFKAKEFDKKYTDLYEIVKGSEKQISGVTYSYRNSRVFNCISSARYEDVKDMDIASKLNIIYNVSGIELFSFTKQDVSDAIKKYYSCNIDENEYPEKLSLVMDEDSYADFTLSEEDDAYTTNASYGLLNSTSEGGRNIDTTSFILGLLDDVQDNGDTIVLKEKIIEISYSGNATYSVKDFTNSKALCNVNESNKFDISKYYNDLARYEYVLKKNSDGYYLSEISLDVDTYDRTSIINGLKDNFKNRDEELYLIDLDKEILGRNFYQFDDSYISFSKDGKFRIYQGWGYGVLGTYKKTNDKIYCTIDTMYAENCPDRKTSGKITFKILDNSKIEVIDASKSYKVKELNYDEETMERYLTNKDMTFELYPIVKGIRFTLIDTSDEEELINKETNTSALTKNQTKYVVTTYSKLGNSIPKIDIDSKDVENINKEIYVLGDTFQKQIAKVFTIKRKSKNIIEKCSCFLNTNLNLF